MSRTHETTEAFADAIGVTQDTIRQGYCRNGHYMGIRPVKLPNRRLLWPIADRERLLRGEPVGNDQLAA